MTRELPERMAAEIQPGLAVHYWCRRAFYEVIEELSDAVWWGWVIGSAVYGLYQLTEAESILWGFALLVYPASHFLLELERWKNEVYVVARDDDNGGGNDNPGGGSHPGVSPDGSDSLPGGASMDTVPGYTTIEEMNSVDPPAGADGRYGLVPWTHPGFDQCTAEVQIPEPYNVVLMLVVDVSGSMTQTAPGTGRTKWEETRDALSYLFDIFPTITELAGVPTPTTVLGESLVPVLRAAETELRDAAFYAYKDLQRGVRTSDDWKLIRYYVDGEHYAQLFDLNEDPHERHNLADDPAHAAERERLERLLLRESRAYRDRLDLADPAWGRSAKEQ